MTGKNQELARWKKKEVVFVEASHEYQKLRERKVEQQTHVALRQASYTKPTHTHTHTVHIAAITLRDGAAEGPVGISINAPPPLLIWPCSVCSVHVKSPCVCVCVYVIVRAHMNM